VSFPIDQVEAAGLLRVLTDIMHGLDDVKSEVMDGDRAKTITSLVAVRGQIDALYAGMIRDLVSRVVKSGKVDMETLDEHSRQILGIT
jgi:hypothetical protein